MEKFIGRNFEIHQLESCLFSERSEFVVIYGRRRIGKTFLVRHFFKDQFYFSYTGGHKLSKVEQLEKFAIALHDYCKIPFIPKLSNWSDAFQLLREYIENGKDIQKKVLFFDEMPWIDTPKSDFVKSLEYFWNSWASLRDDIVFIACGSATSWMVDKLVANKGGLHNRITKTIYLPPFNIHEVEEYLYSRNCQWDRYQILQAYMVFGGVPYYLSLVDYRMSLAQNIDVLFFRKNSQLRNEFSELYSVLFSNYDSYLAVIKCLFSHKNGIEKTKIQDETKLDNKTCTRIIENLERCDFISGFSVFGRKKAKNYRLTDFYTLFYLQFIENDNGLDDEKWSHIINSPTVNSWQGLAFEIVCLCHTTAIKKALGISGMLSNIGEWHNSEAQIDLVIERADRIINLCELKFSTDIFVVSKDYADKLRERTAIFREATGTKKSLVNTLISTYGLKQGKNSGIVSNALTMDDLFS